LKIHRFIGSKVKIAAPPHHVWTVLCDVDSWHTWTASIRKVRRLDQGSLGVGKNVLIDQPKLPPARWRITAWEEGRGFTWVSAAPGTRIAAEHTVEPALEGSEVTLSIQYNGILAGFVYLLTAGITHRYIGLEAAGLKNRVKAHMGAEPAGKTGDQC